MNDSTYLFATPTWAEGVGRLVDFGDTLTEYNTSPDEASADYDALCRDWNAVARDIGAAILRWRARHDM